MIKLGKYSKFVVAAVGATETSLATVYGNTHWVTVISTILTAALVFLVPNNNAV